MPLSDKIIREEVLEMNKTGLAALAALLGAGLITTKTFKSSYASETFMAEGKRAVAIRKNKIVEPQKPQEATLKFSECVNSFWNVFGKNARYDGSITNNVIENGYGLKGKDSVLFSQWIDSRNILSFMMPRNRVQTMQMLAQSAGRWASEKNKAILAPFRVRYVEILQEIHDMKTKAGDEGKYNWTQNNSALKELLEKRHLLIGEVLEKLPLNSYLVIDNPFNYDPATYIEVTERTRDSFSKILPNFYYNEWEYRDGIRYRNGLSGQERLDAMKSGRFPSLEIAYTNKRQDFVKLDLSENDMKELASWVLENETYLYASVLEMNEFFNLNPEIVIFGYAGHPKYEYRYYSMDWVAEGKDVRADMGFAYVMNRAIANSAFVQNDYEAKLDSVKSELKTLAKKLKRKISSVEDAYEKLNKEVMTHNKPLIMEQVKDMFADYDQIDATIEGDRKRNKMQSLLSYMIVHNTFPNQIGINGNFKQLKKEYEESGAIKWKIEQTPYLFVGRTYLPNEISITDFDIPQSLLDLAKEDAKKEADEMVAYEKRVVAKRQEDLEKAIRALATKETLIQGVQDRIDLL